MPLDTIQPVPQSAGRKFFYGVQGTPFVDAAEAWFWTLDCLEARADRSRGCSGLKIGRPCEPDDIVNAMARLDPLPIHARTLMAWGKRREAPPRESQARWYWDEVMDRLSRVLQCKGIVRMPTPAAERQVRDIALMDVPLTGLRSSPLPGNHPKSSGSSPDNAGDLDRALEKLGAAVAEREDALGILSRGSRAAR